MPIQPALMLIADIGGYTRFMKMHRTSLAHAHDIIARLMEAVIDAASKQLTLAKLEGDAAFFYTGYSPGREPDLSFLSDQVAGIYRAFHARIKRMCAGNLCDCEACMQAGNLKIKFAGHFGEAAVHKVKKYTELAGVDVILVHRLLKNTVPVSEYLLMTEPVLQRLDEPLRQRAAPHPVELDDLGRIETYFVDLTQVVSDLAAPALPSLPSRIASLLGMALRTSPFVIGLRKPCTSCRNVPMN
jgi:hypothetical protein